MRFIKHLVVSVLLFIFFVCAPHAVFAQDSKTSYVRAQITHILSNETVKTGLSQTRRVVLELQRTDTQQTFQTETEYPIATTADPERYHVGQTVVVSPQELDGQTIYALVDTYRVPTLLGIFLLFVVVTLLITQKKGLLSFVSLAGSIAVIMLFTVPQMLAGTHPLLVCMISSLLISICVIYPSHGFSNLSHTALASMVLTLTGVTVLAFFATKLAWLTGSGSEEAFFLQIDPTLRLNLQGLFLGGVMLATLSVLDDSVIGQISVIKQLHKANPNLRQRELFFRAMEVGKDHVSTLVNTLFLAYAGASLPLFLLFMQSGSPWWVALNDQMVAEEVVRTMVGSIGLVASIPLTTFVASILATRKTSKK